ncbi:MAG TPA: ROK family protein, partial [Thermodesulfobacteriota bacterium]|nr:ROK family protein [Thermodesulfobacteriota bacterium]
FIPRIRRRDIMEPCALAVDLGGSNIRVAVVTRSGGIAERLSRPSRAAEGREAVLSVLLSALDESEQVLQTQTALGIGIAVAGALDVRSGIVTQSPNLPGLDDTPLRTIVASHFADRLPVLLENDANAAALGESWKGAGVGSQTLVCLTLGTGIGGGIIENGLLLHGADGMAGEIGHMTIDPSGPLCNCGNTGCLEAFSSATAIRRLAIEALGAHPDNAPILLQRCGGSPDRISAEMVAEAAAAGDLLSQTVYHTMGKALGIGIASLINIFNPDTVILGGQVAKAWDLFWPDTDQEVRKRALRVPGRRAHIVSAQQGDDAGLLGAAFLVFSTQGSFSIS